MANMLEKLKAINDALKNMSEEELDELRKQVEETTPEDAATWAPLERWIRGEPYEKP